MREAPWLRRSVNLSMREILVLTSAYARPSVHTYVQTLGGGGGKSQNNPTGEKNANFSWREIARCLWSTNLFLRREWRDHRRFLKKKEVSLKA